MNDQHATILALLRNTASDVFDSKRPKVLAIGTHREIAKTCKITEGEAQSFLRWWCMREQYLKSIVRDASRCDLLGIEKGIIHPKHKEHASAMLERKRNARRKVSA